MQLRATRLTAIASAVKRAIQVFSPAQLFGTGAPGVWYDPSDYSTLFQDSAGTTPVTAVEQPVGLMLDKSQGLVLGPELVTNGDFSAGSAGWSIAYGSFDFSGGTADSVGGGGLAQSTSAVAVGKTYEVQFTVTRFAAGSVRIFFNSNASGGATASVSSTGTFVFRVLCLAATTQVFIQFGGSSPSAAITNISVRELPGNHAFQSTSASRPVLSARYNLLTKTEQFDVWQKANVTAVNTSATTDPLGGNTADKIYPNSTGVFRVVYQTTTGLVVGFYKWSIRVKAAEKNIAYIDFTGGGTILAFFNLSAGTVGTVASGYTATITSLGNGWYECSGTNNTATGYNFGGVYGVADANGSTTVTANGTDGIYIWGASLVPSNQSSIPYQRVNTSTDYATTGFLPYLKFDGVDDSMSTNSINFTSTDKMSVFAGVRKLSDAAAGLLVELSTAYNSNNGAFALFHPDSGSTSAFVGKGTTGAYYSPILPASPLSSVLSMQLNIAGATKSSAIVPRINGVVSQTGGVGSTLGTGNFGNYPLYIGRRNNASAPFNGQLYSMIIVGKAVTSGELSSTETYTAAKTGVTL